MSVNIELVGGPCDGERRMLPGNNYPPCYDIPLMPEIPSFQDWSGKPIDELPEPRRGRYRQRHWRSYLYDYVYEEGN